MEKLLKWNPEFAKNIWLEFSFQRLLVLPGILFLIVLTIFSQDDSITTSMNTLHNVSIAGFVIIGLLWGIKTSSDAILDEYNDKTWDWQKMSIIGPWKLTIGKLFGSTIYNWYGAILCWVLFLISSLYSTHTEIEFKTAILMLISMVSIHGLMIIISLSMVKKADGRTKLKSNRIFIAGILFLVFSGQIFGLSSIQSSFNHSQYLWYGIINNPVDLILLASIFYGSWIVAGVYRSMRAELQFSDSPYWWLLFILTNLIFEFGIIWNIPDLNFILKLAIAFGLMFIQTLIMTYILALTESKDIVILRSILNLFSEKMYNKMFQNISLWLITLAISLIFGILAVCTYLFSFILFKEPLSSTSDVGFNIFSELNLDYQPYLILYLLGIFGFIIRDMGIMLYLNLSKTSKRADSAMLIYLLILYILLPFLTKNSGMGVMFYPDFKANIIAIVVFPLIESAIVIALVMKKWKEINHAIN